MARHALLNTTVVKGRPIFAGSVIDDAQDPGTRVAIEQKGGRFVTLPNTQVEEASRIANERRARGAPFQELDAIMLATAAVAGANTVTSVFGRTGAVVAQSGDYTAGQVGADPAGAAVAAVSAHEGAANPHSQYQLTSEKGAAGGYASLDGSTLVPLAQVPVIDDTKHGGRGGGSLHSLVVAAGDAGFMSGADKTKLDGVGALASTAPVNVTKAAAAVGSGTTAARDDHKHDVSTAAPSGTGVQIGNTAAEGTATTLARSDHAHTVVGGTPVTITDSTNAAGSGTSFARGGHQHAHGTRGGGTLHAAATGSLAGFMSAADKTKLDGLSAGGASTGAVHARITWSSVTTVALGVSGEGSFARDEDDTFDIKWTGVLSAAITTVGPGGRQTGTSETANTWYEVHVIADSTAVNPPAALLIPAGTSFSQSGYDKHRRIGWVRNDGSSNFMDFVCVGLGSYRWYYYSEETSDTNVLTSGSATSWSSVSAAAYAPPSCRLIRMRFVYFNSSAADDFGLRETGSSISRIFSPWGIQPALSTGSNDFRGNELCVVNASQSFDYETQSGGPLNLAVTAFSDEV